MEKTTTQNSTETQPQSPNAEQFKRMRNPSIAIERATFTFPCRKVALNDGRWVLIPMEPNMRCRTEDTVAITGIPAKTLYRLAQAGFIRCARMTENIAFFWPMEIEELIERVANDPAFAAKVDSWSDTDLREVAAT